MVTISLCMIVKNEEDVLGRCLACAAKFADEIVVVDTGSTDKTMEIARRFTDKVYTFEWMKDFSAARNFSFSKATMDYCMWLDADDVVNDENIQKLNELKKTLAPDTDMVKMQYHTGFDQNGNVSFSYYRERLLKRSSGFKWVGAVHEAISAHGKVIHTEIAVEHRKLKPGDGDRNLQIYEHLIETGKPLAPRDQFYYARELFYHEQVSEAIDILNNFLDQGQGWVENNIEACMLLSKCFQCQKDRSQALRALLRSLEFDRPRAEICCAVGDHFMQEKRFETAIFWYETAANQPRDDTSGGFVRTDSYDYYPNMQLCLCYDRLGAYEKASLHNEKAGKIKPDSQAYQYNKTYFDRLFRGKA